MHVDDAVPTVVMSTADKSDSSRKSSPITTSSVHGHSHIRTSPTPQQVTLCREREGCDELLYAWSFHSCRVEVSVAIFYKAGVRGVKNADSLMLFLQVSHLLFPFPQIHSFCVVFQTTFLLEICLLSHLFPEHILLILVLLISLVHLDLDFLILWEHTVCIVSLISHPLVAASCTVSLSSLPWPSSFLFSSLTLSLPSSLSLPFSLSLSYVSDEIPTPCSCSCSCTTSFI